MFGIGPTELLILIVIGVLVVGVPIALVVLLLFLISRRNSAGKSLSHSQFLEENPRLSPELAAERKKEATPDRDSRADQSTDS